MQGAIISHFHTFLFYVNNSMEIYIISILKMSKLRYKEVSKLSSPCGWPVKIQLAVYDSES